MEGPDSVNSGFSAMIRVPIGMSTVATRPRPLFGMGWIVKKFLVSSGGSSGSSGCFDIDVNILTVTIGYSFPKRRMFGTNLIV